MTVPTIEAAQPTGQVRLSPATLFRQSFRMLRDNPRQSMLPMLVIQVPAAAIGGLATALCYLTIFPHEEYGATNGGPLLALLLVAAFEGLFAQVARAGTIVSIASVATGRPKSLAESLDPAFTRMGPLIALVAILAGGFFVGILSVVGLVLIPYVGLRVALSFETFVLEELGPWAAVRRAWTISAGNLWRLFGLVLMTVAAMIGPLLAIQSISMIEASGRTEQILLGGILTFVQGVLLIPVVAFLTASTTLFYLNLTGQNNG